MEWQIVPGYDRGAELENLFAAYTRMLIDGEPEMAGYLDQQGYRQEIAHLEEKYGAPDGRLYVAESEGRVVGCIALRRFDDESGELKRLYVVPECRGWGIARALTLRLLADARAIGYRRVLLDTLPFRTEAMALYESVGFRRVAKYNDSPLPEDKTFFYCLEL